MQSGPRGRPFQYRLFSVVGCVGVAQLVSRFVSEEIASCVAIYSVCLLWGEEGGIQEPHMLPTWIRLPFAGRCKDAVEMSLAFILDLKGNTFTFHQ